MVTTFQSRRLRIVVQLVNGTFDESGNYDTVTIEGADGFRMSAEIQMIGGFFAAQGRIRIWGLAQETMNRLFCITDTTMQIKRNLVTVYATDDDGTYSSVFSGVIIQSMPDYTGMPDVPLIIEAITSFDAALATASPDSYKGAVLISEIASKIAKTMAVSLENNGVTGYLTDECLSGSAMDRLRKLAKDGHFDFYLDPNGKILSITPFGKKREKTAVDLNVKTGLVGVPIRNIRGVAFTALFNSNLVPGWPIKITSELSKPCNGEWYISSAQYSLSCNMPGGPWFVHAQAASSDYVVRTE